MDIKKHFTKLKEKLKKIDFKTKIGTKAFITVGCVMLICAAVLVSVIVNRNSDLAGETDESRRVLGNALLVDTLGDMSAAEAEASAAENDFFAMAMINRTQVRDNALEILKTIAEDPSALPDAKEEALSSIRSIADEMTAEANIETLIEAKGIPECVAVISGNFCSVVVNAPELTAPQLTQITGIVQNEIDIPVANITVVTN